MQKRNKRKIRKLNVVNVYNLKEKTKTKNRCKCRQNKRLGSKLSPRYKKEIVAENRTTTVLTLSGKTIHKSHIKN